MALAARMVQVVHMVQKDPVALVALVALMTEHTGTTVVLGKLEKAWIRSSLALVASA